MLVLPWTSTIKAKSINSKWSNAGLQGVSPIDSVTHLFMTHWLAALN